MPHRAIETDPRFSRCESARPLHHRRRSNFVDGRKGTAMSDVRDRITKLLAMANDSRGNEHENEIAMRMAERLMRQHNIDVADLEASTGKKTIYNWRNVIIPVGEKAQTGRAS